MHPHHQKWNYPVDPNPWRVAATLRTGGSAKKGAIKLLPVKVGMCNRL